MIATAHTRLADLAEVEIDGLMDEGITPTPAEVVAINAIAHSIATPSARIELARGAPVEVGNATLYPMTMYGHGWFLDVGSTFRGESRQLWAMAYAMAHRGQDMPTSPAKAWGAVWTWARSLHCTRRQIEEAVRQVHDQEDTDLGAAKHKGGSLGDLSATLAAVTGTDPAIWEHRCCLSYAVAVLAKNAELNTRNDGAGESVKDDETMRAEWIMGKYLARIRRRHAKGMTDG